MGITRGLHRYDKRKGHSGRQAPTTAQGAMMSLKKIRLYCQQCTNLQSVASVTALQQNAATYSASVVLECSHGRLVTLAAKQAKTEQEQEEGTRRL